MENAKLALLVCAAAWFGSCSAARAQDFPLLASPAQAEGREPEIAADPQPSADLYRRHLDTQWLHRSLTRDVLAPWLAAAFTGGGHFQTKLDGHWTPRGEQCATLVSQSRLLYVFSVGYDVTGEQRYLDAVRQGADYLLERFPDRRYGGWFWSVSAEGEVTSTRKNTYGHAFVIFGLSHAYRVTGDERYLKAASDCWATVHDRMTYARGGIAACTDRTFTHVLENNNEDVLVHMFEALLALHDASGSPEVLRDAQKLADFVLDRLYQKEAGCLPLNFDRNWDPVPSGKPGYTDVNLGHHFEWAYFLSRAVDKGFPTRYLQTAERLLDYGLDVGYDPVEGGVHWAGRYDGTPVRGPKMWWAQCEFLRATIRYAVVHGRDDLWPIVDQSLELVKQNFLDQQRGGWHEMYAPGAGGTEPADKGSLWKVGYHATGMYEAALCPWAGSGRVRLRSTDEVQLAAGVSSAGARASAPDGLLRLRGSEESALFRFAATAARGREIRGATLFLRSADADKLRYVRVSTVNQDWNQDADYGHAGLGPEGPITWAWPGSSAADAVLSSGNSLESWGDRRELAGGWIAVPLDARLVYALALGDTDGLAVLEGGSPGGAVRIHGVSSDGSAPFIEVRLGRPLLAEPARPEVTATPAPEWADWSAGAIRISIAPAEGVQCWRLRLDGHPVPRWQVGRSSKEGGATFVLENVRADTEYELEVVAVSAGGRSSPPSQQSVRSSRALEHPKTLVLKDAGNSDPAEPSGEGSRRVWALPALVRIDPTNPPAPRRNPIWDGQRISLFGARGEFVAWQLCIDRRDAGPPGPVRVRPGRLVGPEGAAIGQEHFEVCQYWYVRDDQGRWGPSYCSPLPAENGSPGFASFAPTGSDGRCQTVALELYIPKDAGAGEYAGVVEVAAASGDPAAAVRLPVRLEVFDFALPDRLSFWPELDGEGLPERVLEHYRVAHRHRCVLNLRGWRPALEGAGRETRVRWEEFDRQAGPLLTGEAFAENPRSRVPIECMTLPFQQGWPTPLSKVTYGYHGSWSAEDEDLKPIIEHYLTAPYVGLTLSDEYKQAFLAVQRQFVEHFHEKRYLATEMQCSLAGRVTVRVGSDFDAWWNLEEPTYWNDWLALQFFGHLWDRGRGGAHSRRWPFRANISVPEWQGRLLSGVLDVGYYPADQLADPAAARRLDRLSRQLGSRVRAYAPLPPGGAQGMPCLPEMLAAWAGGAEGIAYRRAAGTTAEEPLLALENPAGARVVPHVRLKEIRTAQQLIEYLHLLAHHQGLRRKQIAVMLGPAKSSPDPWQLPDHRRRLAEQITE
jgi:mannose/cellobiose epimerase-like protein (N-acyl-D-glucosamine 2-epimerase family)